jgi:hypothetical protein
MVSEIARRLCCRFVINAGKSGDTTTDGRARFQRNVLDKNPRVIVFVIGGNNILKRLHIDQARLDFREMLLRAHNAGAICVLTGIQGGRFGKDLEIVCKELSAETGCAYIPNILYGVITNFRLKSDIVHPNNEGYEIVAKRIAPVISILETPPVSPEISGNFAKVGENPIVWTLSVGQTYIIRENVSTIPRLDRPAIIRWTPTGILIEVPEDLENFWKIERIPKLEPVEENPTEVLED